jgi:hypothetical protein
VTRRAPAEPAAGGAGRAPLDLIHTNNSPKRASMRVAAVSYSLERGDSDAVVQAAFALALKLAKGAYDRTT